MIYTIFNGFLTATAEDLGAQLVSLRSGAAEYIWQRDEAFWKDSSPNLFPYIARLYDGKYTFQGKTYEMKIHGFVKYSKLKLCDKTDTSMTFCMTENEKTLEQFPWKFAYRITYSLEGDTLVVTTSVENTDEKTMYFGVGGHPGFCVPLEEGLAYEDYYVELPEADGPVRIGFSEKCFRNGADQAYPVDENHRIPLAHSLFTNDAIVLKNAGHKAVIGSEKGEKKVTVCWDHPYVGIWSRPTEAPYVCIEPWAGLPSRDGGVEDFEKQEDLNRLESGETFTIRWSAKIH